MIVLLALASTITGEDLCADGRRLERLGISTTDRTQMAAFLHDGC